MLVEGPWLFCRSGRSLSSSLLPELHYLQPLSLRLSDDHRPICSVLLVVQL